jgi:hypothetical protein
MDDRVHFCPWAIPPLPIVENDFGNDTGTVYIFRVRVANFIRDVRASWEKRGRPADETTEILGRLEGMDGFIYKIGMTRAEDIEERRRRVWGKAQTSITLETTGVADLEKELHFHFRAQRVGWEYFRLSAGHLNWLASMATFRQTPVKVADYRRFPTS